jgi:hypothetical protein
VAVNTFLDVSCRCGRDRLAYETFHYYFRKRRLKADVVSYTVLISSLLKKETPAGVERAMALYRKMRSQGDVAADTTLIDILLKALVRCGRRTRGLSKMELDFAADVFRDAERLDWADGQLERRKRAVQSVLGSKQRMDWMRQGEGVYQQLLKPEDDELFLRKGWNQVDSGFRVWGSVVKDDTAVDDFLQSKGWNDVDSGFRIL